MVRVFGGQPGERVGAQIVADGVGVIRQEKTSPMKIAVAAAMIQSVFTILSSQITTQKK